MLRTPQMITYCAKCINECVCVCVCVYMNVEQSGHKCVCVCACVCVCVCVYLRERGKKGKVITKSLMWRVMLSLFERVSISLSASLSLINHFLYYHSNPLHPLSLSLSLSSLFSHTGKHTYTHFLYCNTRAITPHQRLKVVSHTPILPLMYKGTVEC